MCRNHIEIAFDGKSVSGRISLLHPQYVICCLRHPEVLSYADILRNEGLAWYMV